MPLEYISKSNKETEDLNLITEYGNPHQVISTHYGQLKRLHWQRLEVKRIGDCRIHWKNGLCAITKGKRELNLSTDKQALKERGFIPPVKKDKI